MKIRRGTADGAGQLEGLRPKTCIASGALRQRRGAVPALWPGPLRLSSLQVQCLSSLSCATGVPLRPIPSGFARKRSARIRALPGSRPLPLRNPRLRVAPAREYEQQIGEPIEIANQRRGDRPPFTTERHGAPLRAPADGARDVELSAEPRASGKDEAREWGEVLLEPVDPGLEPRHLRSVTRSSFSSMRSSTVASSAPTTEELVLDLPDLARDLARALARSRRVPRPGRASR